MQFVYIIYKNICTSQLYLVCVYIYIYNMCLFYACTYLMCVVTIATYAMYVLSKESTEPETLIALVCVYVCIHVYIHVTCVCRICVSTYT